MARVFNQNTITILEQISQYPGITATRLFSLFEKKISYKDFYNTLFRLSDLELVTKDNSSGKVSLTITPEGEKVLARKMPKRDGVWKLVIFDIPEKQKYVRTVLRAKLKSLGFQKWQNSIWISPFALDDEVEDELKQLAQRFFVRLIKTTDINETDDLEKMFK